MLFTYHIPSIPRIKTDSVGYMIRSSAYAISKRTRLPRWFCTGSIVVLSIVALVCSLALWCVSPRFRAYMRARP